MADIRRLTLARPDVMTTIRDTVPNSEELLLEFTPFWDGSVLEQAMSGHRDRAGHKAGAGPVDFAEAFVLYGLTRDLQPAHVLELGFASGVSSWIIAHALERNGRGVLDTVDVKDNGSTIAPFRDLCQRGVIRPHFQDARAFVRDTDTPYELTFSDALHTLDFNVELATELRSTLPDAVHCYHEWSLSPLTTRAEAGHVSIRRHLGTCGEREAFTAAFGSGYRHAGVPSSSGIGVVFPIGRSRMS
jgi:hypothetical protein